MDQLVLGHKDVVDGGSVTRGVLRSGGVKALHQLLALGIRHGEALEAAGLLVAVEAQDAGLTEP